MNTQSKGDRSWPAKHPPMAKLVSHQKWSSNFVGVKFQNVLALVWFKLVLYIENLGAIVNLVTPPRFVEPMSPDITSLTATEVATANGS